MWVFDEVIIQSRRNARPPGVRRGQGRGVGRA